jgi:putative hemolysin
LDTDPSKQIDSLNVLTSYIMSDVNVGMLIVIGLVLLLLLFFSAVVSGSEVAFFSLSPNDFFKLEQENDSASKRILELRDQPRTLLATILISNNMINVAIVILSELLIGSVVSEETFSYFGLSIYGFMDWVGLPLEFWAGFSEFLLTVLLVTFLLVLFGEITPKIYANLYNVQVARAASFLLYFLNVVFGPISRILVNTSHWLESKLQKDVEKSQAASREEIDRAIDLTVLHVKDAEREKSILKSIVKFGDVSVKQIMKARVDMVCLDYESNFREVMRVIRESGYSRMPIFQEDPDNIKGILYVKDLLGFYKEQDDFEWQKLIREHVLYLPEAKKINDVLKDFRSLKMHMGIVVDEYGGTAGLVTLEDIMEEVIGDIKDEFDDDLEIQFEKKDEFNYIFDGKTMINDMCKILSLEKEIFEEIRGDADSVAGLFLEMFGQIPKKNTEIKYNQFVFKVISVNRTRIEKVQITLPK